MAASPSFESALSDNPAPIAASRSCVQAPLSWPHSSSVHRISFCSFQAFCVATHWWPSHSTPLLLASSFHSTCGTACSVAPSPTRGSRYCCWLPSCPSPSLLAGAPVGSQVPFCSHSPLCCLGCFSCILQTSQVSQGIKIRFFLLLCTSHTLTNQRWD